MRRLILLPLLLLALAAPAKAGGLELPKDKQLHILAGAGIAAVVYLGAKAEGLKHPEWWAIGAAILAGLLKEVADRREPGNKFDGGDLTATAFGGFVITYTIRW